MLSLQSKADFELLTFVKMMMLYLNKSVVSAGNLNYNWKFGDASNSSSQSPRHRYKLVVFLKHTTLLWLLLYPGGCSDSITKAVTVNANPMQVLHTKQRSFGLL
jgi:hypothetical protein